MSEEEQVAPSEATPEVVESSEATENTEGQVETPPAEDSQDGNSEDKSESQKRRERRKALEQRLRQEAETARKEAESLRQRISAAPGMGEPPKESNYTDYAEYQADLAAYKAVQALADRDKRMAEDEAGRRDQLAQTLEAERKRALVASLDEQRQEAAQRYADFEQVFLNAYIPDHVAEIVIESDVAADVAYHLGKNPALARSIAAMPPLAAVRAIGRLEATIAMPKPKVQTQAPDPLKTVRPSASASKDPDKMSAAEYRAWREAGGSF